MQTIDFRGVETTTYTNPEGELCGVYRGTIVAKRLPNGDVVLNSGGWKTATTKNCMNQFSATHCNHRYGVFQKNREWFVSLGDKNIPFIDGMIV